MLKLAARALIRLYQIITINTLPSCRYYPSCSNYAIEAIEKYGLIKGGGLAAWRLLRCNPWSRGGYDPVP